MRKYSKMAEKMVWLGDESDILEILQQNQFWRSRLTDTTESVLENKA